MTLGNFNLNYHGLRGAWVFNIRDAARVLGVTPRRMYQIIAEEKLPEQRDPRGYIYFTLQDLEGYVMRRGAPRGNPSKGGTINQERRHRTFKERLAAWLTDL
jgi:hypothetical protein